MLSFDFAEVCVPIANALAPVADVELMMPDRVVEPVRTDIASGVRLEAFAMPRLRQATRQVGMCRRIGRAIAAFEPDVVHLQQGHLWFNLSLPLLRVRALVVTIHDLAHHPGDRASLKTPQRVLDLGWARAHDLIVHTEVTKRAVVERYGRDPAAVHVIPHVAIESPQREAPTRDRPIVLFFGRIWPYKGLDHLIRAQPLITERVPDARIVIAGHGEDFKRYRDLMLDPSRFVVINEFVSIERRRELFAEAAVVVLPYVEASQSGVVPIAYAFRKPVVVTAVGGLPETVEDGSTGLVVAAGLRKLECEWSPAAVAEQTMRVYERSSHHHAATRASST
jgi:glycosyltransferase involved in cell wall biosynthesis